MEMAKGVLDPKEETGADARTAEARKETSGYERNQD